MVGTLEGGTKHGGRKRPKGQTCPPSKLMLTLSLPVMDVMYLVRVHLIFGCSVPILNPVETKRPGTESERDEQICYIQQPSILYTQSTSYKISPGENIINGSPLHRGW